jgi:hypothetical protein
MPALIHQLTGAPGQLAASSVACGARDAACASWDARQVTCPTCARACTCGPGTTPCPACRALDQVQGRLWNRQHGARQTTPPTGFTTEKAFQEWLRGLALAQGWTYYHTNDSRRSPSGFPDVLAVRGDRLVVAELKLPGKRPTAAQQQWLDALARVSQVTTHLWSPEDLETIREVLQ